MMKTKLSIMLLFAMAFFSAPVFSQFSDAATIGYIRPFVGSNIVNIGVSTTLCQGRFFIDVSKPNGKLAYAAALTALTSNKKVNIEISDATGCAAGYTEVVSI